MSETEIRSWLLQVLPLGGGCEAARSGRSYERFQERASSRPKHNPEQTSETNEIGYAASAIQKSNL